MTDKLQATRIALAVVLTASLSACATAPRSDSATLAKSGLTATGSLASDVNDLSKRILQADVQDAFSKTWVVCESTPKFCAPKTPSSDLSAERDALAKTIAARARAVRALNAAYSALATEADYDARGDASGAVSAAFDSAKAYASLAGAGAVPAIVGDIASFGAGLLADRAQAKRLRTDNLMLANVANQLRAGLAKEEETFGSIAKAIVDQEVEAQGFLVISGLASGGQALAPLSDSVATALVKDPDAVLAKSVSARTATQAAVISSANRRVASLRSRYGASLAALSELSRQHAEAAQDRPLDLTTLNTRLAELDALLAQISSH